MPYAQQYRKRKRIGGGRNGKRRKAAHGMQIIPSQAGYVRVGGFYGRFANGGEMKFHDVAVDDASLAANGQIQNAGTINVIPQGTDENERIGRKVTIKMIMWHYNLKLLTSSSAGAPDTVRCILYQDKQANGATATAVNIYETDNYQSFRNLAETGRFIIHYDKTHALNAMAAAGNGTANDAPDFELNRSFFKKVMIPLEYSGTNGTIGEIRSNNLGIIIFSKVGARVQLDSQIRLRYSDA